MAAKRLTLCAGGVLLCMFAIVPGARAGGPNVDQVGDGSFSQSLDKSIQKEKAEVDGPASGSDLSAEDLAATRAAIDRQTGSAISLSVSGWVGGEVSRTGR